MAVFKSVAAGILIFLGMGGIALASPYPVDPIRQPSRMSCWAAATTMLMNYGDQYSRPIEAVVALAGPKYVGLYEDSFPPKNLGISPSDEEAFYKALKLNVIKGLNPTIPGWKKLLNDHGPLSITVDADPGKGFIHALVVTGIEGDGTAVGTIVTYIDPADGKKYAPSFANFLKLYEGSANWPLQIIYYKKPA